jgi:tetratricopeptide (TPR) repeat protein
MKDENGLDVTTDDTDVISILGNFRSELLKMGKGVTDILDRAEAYPDNALIQACCASVYLYGQNSETDIEAEKFLERTKETLAYANEREKLFVSALDSWYLGRLDEAAKKLEGLISEWPADLVSAKVLEFIYYSLGQQYSGPRFLKAMEGIYETNKNSGYFLSSYSFAQELCGSYDKALASAERAIEIDEINPWAHHTLSHVYIKKGEIAAGTKILEDYEHIWQQSGQAINSHNYWHLALMYLEELERDKAFSVLGTHILKDSPYLVIQQLDAISLLWRLEMAGYEVPYKEWKNLADITARNVKECYIPFMSAHYVYAQARAGNYEELTGAFSYIRASTSLKSGQEARVWNETGIPLLSACKELASCNYAVAAALFEPIIDNVVMVGGSDAQDDLFRQAYLTSLINSGMKPEARAYLDKISTSEKPTPLEEYWRSHI